jgi:hypothetical protein
MGLLGTRTSAYRFAFTTADADAFTKQFSGTLANFKDTKTLACYIFTALASPELLQGPAWGWCKWWGNSDLPAAASSAAAPDPRAASAAAATYSAASVDATASATPSSSVPLPSALVEGYIAFVQRPGDNDDIGAQYLSVDSTFALTTHGALVFAIVGHDFRSHITIPRAYIFSLSSKNRVGHASAILSDALHQYFSSNPVPHYIVMDKDATQWAALTGAVLRMLSPGGEWAASRVDTMRLLAVAKGGTQLNDPLVAAAAALVGSIRGPEASGAPLSVVDLTGAHALNDSTTDLCAFSDIFAPEVLLRYAVLLRGLSFLLFERIKRAQEQEAACVRDGTLTWSLHELIWEPVAAFEHLLVADEKSCVRRFLRTHVTLRARLCRFHAERSLQAKMGMEAETTRAARPLMYTASESDLARVWSSFVDKFSTSDPDAVAYMRENWMCDRWLRLWAGPFRYFAHGGDDTTARSESLNSSIKRRCTLGHLHASVLLLLEKLVGLPEYIRNHFNVPALEACNAVVSRKSATRIRECVESRRRTAHVARRLPKLVACVNDEECREPGPEVGQFLFDFDTPQADAVEVTDMIVDVISPRPSVRADAFLQTCTCEEGADSAKTGYSLCAHVLCAQYEMVRDGSAPLSRFPELEMLLGPQDAQALAAPSSLVHSKGSGWPPPHAQASCNTGDGHRHEAGIEAVSPQRCIDRDLVVNTRLLLARLKSHVDSLAKDINRADASDASSAAARERLEGIWESLHSLSLPAADTSRRLVSFPFLLPAPSPVPCALSVPSPQTLPERDRLLADRWRDLSRDGYKVRELAEWTIYSTLQPDVGPESVIGVQTPGFVCCGVHDHPSLADQWPVVVCEKCRQPLHLACIGRSENVDYGPQWRCSSCSGKTPLRPASYSLSTVYASLVTAVEREVGVPISASSSSALVGGGARRPAPAPSSSAPSSSAPSSSASSASALVGGVPWSLAAASVGLRSVAEVVGAAAAAATLLSSSSAAATLGAEIRRRLRLPVD